MKPFRFVPSLLLAALLAGLAAGTSGTSGVSPAEAPSAGDSAAATQKQVLTPGYSQSQNSTIFVLVPSKNKNNQYQIKIDTKTVLTDTKGKNLTLNNNIISGKKLIAVIKPDSQIAQTFYAVLLITLDPAANSPPPTPKP